MIVTDLNQKQWKKACKKLGLVVDTKSGKGSHIRVCHPSGKLRPLTIPYKPHKFISISIYKTLMEWGYEESEIDNALR